MTIEEFNKQQFCAGMSVIYKGNNYNLACVDFEESLIGYLIEFGEDISWVRCENVIIVNR